MTSIIASGLTRSSERRIAQRIDEASMRLDNVAILIKIRPINSMRRQPKLEERSKTRFRRWFSSLSPYLNRIIANFVAD